VTKITPTGAMITYKGTGDFPFGIAFDGTNMWTANAGINNVTEITPRGTMTTYSGTGSAPLRIAFDGTNMWTANYGSGYGNSVTKILVNRGY
jgi:DNA-binding beta-propeller fold protein YncE